MELDMFSIKALEDTATVDGAPLGEVVDEHGKAHGIVPIVEGHTPEDLLRMARQIVKATPDAGRYSERNTATLLHQMLQRSITPGPCAGYNAWKKLGRQVIKGQQALKVTAPVLVDDETTPTGKRIVNSKPRSTFTLAQTIEAGTAALATAAGMEVSA